MSPKAKVARTGDGDDATPAGAASTSQDEHETELALDPPATAPSPEEGGKKSIAEPSPFDAEEFLEANRRNRDKMRAAAQAKRAKEAARARRRESPWWKRAPGAGAGASQTPVGETDAVAAPPEYVDPVRTRSRWVVPALSVLLVAALVAAGAFAYLYREANDRANAADQINQLRPGAVESAKQYAGDLMTYDSADFGALDSRITDISTPEFATDFIEGSRQAREGSANAQAVATALVKDAGVVSISSTEAVLIVALDQTITSPQTARELPGGIPYQSRVKITLTREGDRWLISDFEVI
jgi:Mce-associated membrane protein